jgi:hypothetical protein
VLTHASLTFLPGNPLQIVAAISASAEEDHVYDTGDHINDRLAALNEEYTFLVNELVGQGREQDAAALSRSYERDVADLLASIANVNTI